MDNLLNGSSQELAAIEKYIFVPPDKIYKMTTPIKDKHNQYWYATEINPATGRMTYANADECGVIAIDENGYTLSIKKDNMRCILKGNSFEDVIQLYFEANPAKLLLESVGKTDDNV